MFALKVILENKFVADMANIVFESKICPLLVMNSTICEGGVKNVANPIIKALIDGIMDPEYFCENTLVLCHDGDY